MPFVWEPNEKYLEHVGPHGPVSIYYIYKDDSADCGVRAFWFATTPDGSDQGSAGSEFDVRELEAAAGTALGGLLGDEETIRAIIIRAIESGELRAEEQDDE